MVYKKQTASISDFCFQLCTACENKSFLLRIKILYYLGCGKFDTQVDADTARSRPKIVLHKPLRWNSLGLVYGAVQNPKSSLDSLYFG